MRSLTSQLFRARVSATGRAVRRGRAPDEWKRVSWERGAVAPRGDRLVIDCY
jgi:hypothetical protein